MALVDLETARRNLKVPDTADDENLVTLIDQASSIVLDYLKVASTTYQDGNSNPSGVPKHVEAATLLVLRSLYDTPDVDPITEAVRSVLMRSRDPAIA